MELFFADRIDGGLCFLPEEEAAHCVRVLRHRAGDGIDVIDGTGTLYRCTLDEASPKGARARIRESVPGWGAHPYQLTMAVCPTKHNDRYEWFVEKAVEVGVDRIVPVIGERSERRVYKPERARRIALSATKQSLKAAIPAVDEPVSVADFIRGCTASLKLIAYCFEEDAAPRRSIAEVLRTCPGTDIAILIGPEGDFSPGEARLALACGFVPVHLGPSRLRTETAAVTAVESVYFHFCL